MKKNKSSAKTASARRKTMLAAIARPEDSMQDIIRKMDWAALEIILVVNDAGELVGTITDGDIRRGILAGSNLDDPAEGVMNRTPIAVPLETPRSEMLDIMKRFSIRHLPVLDNNRRPIRLELLDDVIDDIAGKSAVIMAGGQGQRLRPLTASTPKPLLKVGDRPILDHILKALNNNGIKDVVISVNYLGNLIQDHLGDGRDHSLNVNYVSETKRLGTAGALSMLRPKPTKAFLVMNGDLLTTLNFNAMLRYQKKTGHDMVVCVRKQFVKVPYGVVEVRDGAVSSLREKPVYEHFINAGIYVLEPKCLDLIPEDVYFDMPDLIQKLMDNGYSVGAFPVVEYWRDIGNPEDFQAANSEKMNLDSVVMENETGSSGVPMEVIK